MDSMVKRVMQGKMVPLGEPPRSTTAMTYTQEAVVGLLFVTHKTSVVEMGGQIFALSSSNYNQPEQMVRVMILE